MIKVANQENYLPLYPLKLIITKSSRPLPAVVPKKGADDRDKSETFSCMVDSNDEK